MPQCYRVSDVEIACDLHIVLLCFQNNQIDEADVLTHALLRILKVENFPTSVHLSAYFRGKKHFSVLALVILFFHSSLGGLHLSFGNVTKRLWVHECFYFSFP